MLDAGDAADVLDLLREEHGHAQAQTRFPRKGTLLDIYSRTVNAQEPLSGVIAEHFPWCEDHREAISALFKAYTARKRALGVIDLDDLLLYWRALARDEVIGPRLAASFDHVLVDEYQDVNGLQVDIVRSLGASGPAITAVGDDFQAIYGFRSASAAHILDFPAHFDGTRVVTLERNYRSTQPVLDAANAVAAQASRAFPKRLRADRPGGVRPRVIHVRDEAAQAEEVCTRVLEAREQGSELRAQAVLMRTSHDSDLLELELAPPPDPVREVRRAALPGGRAREGLHRAAAAGRQRRRRRRVVPRSCSSSRASARRARGRRSRRWRRRAASSRRRCATRSARVAWPRCRTGWRRGRTPARRCPRARARARTRVIAALLAAREEPRAGPRAEGLRDVLAPLVKARYPDGALRVQDLDQLVDAAHQASDPRHFVAELVLDPPQSSADLAQPPHLDEDYLRAVHDPLGQGPGVGQRARARGLRRELPGLPVRGHERVDRRGAAAAVRRDDARAADAAPVRARCATTTARTAATTRTATASRRASSRPRCSRRCDVTRLPDDPLNPYGAPVVTRRRVSVSGLAVRLGAAGPANCAGEGGGRARHGGG